jgi:2-polyprenyl-3-methyl-5-hydroxy-6-metoxy-1,4-benzoquinol methylase
MADTAAPPIRTFTIDGEERVDHTLRTAIVEHFARIRGASVLDLGAADGYESRALAMRGARRAVAVEGKQSMFDDAVRAKRELGLENQEVLRLDVRGIDEHALGTFDVVLCFGLLYHLENPFNFLKRVRRVTDGVLLLETHVAPATLDGLRDVHASLLPAANDVVELDGVPFVA